jgi:hypothetical protein
MSGKRLTRSAGALLALTGAAALLTGGIAAAHGEQYHANHGSSGHAAKASATVQPRQVARTAGSACPNIKSAPPSSTGFVAVNGHTVRVTPAGAPTAGPAERKGPGPAGAGSVAVNSHTVRLSPAGAPSAGPC